MRRAGIKLSIVVVLASASAQAQPHRYEVATIKPVGAAPPAASLALGTNDGGRLVTKGTSLQVLVQFAYGVLRYQIAGAPGWFADEAYEIEAKPETPFSPTADEVRAMLRTLLAERFGLSVKRETREGTVYNLVAAKGGTKLLETTTPQEGRSIRGGIESFTGTGVRLESLRQVISSQLERPVIDQTGLSGAYDIDLHWTPERQLSAEATPQADGDSLPDRKDSLYTALTEQLGLKLERAKGPIETLVIQSVEKPDSN